MPNSYPLLLLSWAFLLPVVFLSYRRGAKPLAVLLVFAINLFFMLYEAYMTFVWSKTVVAPIRVDIFGVIIILVVLNTLTSLAIWFVQPAAAGLVRSRRIEKAMALVLMAVSVNAAVGLARVFRAGGKATQTMLAATQLEFQTKFQDAVTVRRYFGDLGADSREWAGHYAAEPKAGGWLTRLVINTDGKVWLFFTCDPKTECVYVEGEDAALRRSSRSIRVAGLKPRAGIWTASLDLERQTEDRLGVSLIMGNADSPNAKAWEPSTKHLIFVRTPPPSFPRTVSADDSVEYLGVFSNGDVQGDTLYAIQVWLWRSDHELFGRYLRRGLQLGSKVDFVSADAFTGTFDPASGRVAFKANDQESFEGRVGEGGVLEGQLLWLGRPWKAIRLKRKELIAGFPYDFAPRTNAKTTQEWLRVASFGRRIYWQVPTAFEPSTW